MTLHHPFLTNDCGANDDRDFPDINDSQPHIKLHDSPTHPSTSHILPLEIAEEVESEIADLRLEDLM